MAPTTCYVNYLDDSAESTLHRNGRIYIPRAEDGRDGDLKGATPSRVLKSVRDRRATRDTDWPQLDRDGFELLEACAPRGGLDFLDDTAITGEYYRHCEALVKKHTNATRVSAFDHNVRSAQGVALRVRIEGGQRVLPPAAMVHADYTLTSAPATLARLTRPAGKNDTFARRGSGGDGDGDWPGLIDAAAVDGALIGGKRFAIVNVWRNVKRDEVVRSMPLAMCDVRTMSPAELAVLEIRYEDRTGENYLAKHSEQHEWSYFSNVRHDEAILLKTWDSHGAFATTNGRQAHGDVKEDPLSTFVLHSAVDLAEADENEPARWSIEVRCMVLY